MQSRLVTSLSQLVGWAMYQAGGSLQIFVMGWSVPQMDDEAFWIKDKHQIG